MTREIISKEILQNLLSLRFILSLLIIISLFGVGGFVFTSKYRQEIEDYWRETNQNMSAMSEHSVHLYELALYEQTVWRKPNPLALCADGFERFLPNCYKFNIFTIEYPKVRSRSNFMLPRFSYVDWTFIISVILSFVAVTLTYDTISGEREAGTLRLMLAGSIPRHKIIFGKYFGAMFTLTIPLFLGLFVNLIIVVASNLIVISVSGWLKIIIIILLSFLYLSGFVLMGMFVSSRTSNSTINLVTVLLAWVGLVILIPSLGRIAANTLYKIPSSPEWEKMKIAAEEDVWRNAVAGKYGKHAADYSPNPGSSGVNPVGRAKFENAMDDARNRIVDEHLNQMMAQTNTGRRFTRISPVVVYQCISETIAGTGINPSLSLYRQVKQYRQNFREYIRSKDKEDPKSLHLLLNNERAIEDWVAISKESVDFDGVPKFQEQSLALTESLKGAIWDIGLLVIFNLAFFAASFTSFLSYDVR